MNNLSCQHCSGSVEAADNSCPNCGIPLPPNHDKQRQKRFVVWFIGLVIFCVFIMLWLPPDWSPLVAK